MHVSFARRLSNAILTFLFTLVAFILIGITVIQQTLFSPDFYISQIDASGFSQTALAEIQDSFRSYVNALDLSISIPDEFVTDHITLGQVDEAIKHTITASFNNTAPYDYSSFTDQLFNDLQNYVETEIALLYADAPDVDFTEQMTDFTARCEEIFASYVDAPIFTRVASLSRTYGQVIEIMQIVLVIAALLLFLLLLRLASTWAAGCRNLVFAFGMLVLLNGVCMAARLFPAQTYMNYFGINLDRESLRLLANQCVESAAAAFTTPLIVCVACLIIVIIIYLIVRKTAQRNRD